MVTCGITLAQDDRVLTAASADALAQQLDELQYEYESGPCLQALATGEVVTAEDLGTERRWGGYPTAAMAHGILSILSVPLIVDCKPVGVLNIYAGAVRAFSMVDRQLADLAGRAGGAMLRAISQRRNIKLRIVAAELVDATRSDPKDHEPQA